MTFLHYIDSAENAPRKQKDMASLVCVVGGRADYTKGEIALLEGFADAHMAWDDGLSKDKRDAAYVFFRKCEDGRWERRKETWEKGPFFSPTLEDALTTMYTIYGLPIPPDVRLRADGGLGPQSRDELHA
ncbi:MAG: hypothetical protein PHE27_05015 [Alphaproteobacteria bacterium]|nr:hypothetical protein [Alphaproteobacteria bacterium]